MDAESLKLRDIIRAVESLISGHFLRPKAQALFDLSDQGNQLSLVVRVTLMGLIVQNYTRAVLVPRSQNKSYFIAESDSTTLS